MQRSLRTRSTADPAIPPETRAGGSSYALLTIALFSLIAATFGIANGLDRLASANREVEMGYRVIGAAEGILAVARDAETGQRGYLLTGEERFLDPYRAATARAPVAWAELERLAIGPRKVKVSAIRRSFAEKEELNARTILVARTQGMAAARAFVGTEKGKAKMDVLRSQVTAFVDEERRKLRLLQIDSKTAYRDALLQALVASFALVLAGALLYAAIRQAQTAAAHNAERAKQANRRFQATFEQSAVGMIHLTNMGGPIMVNDAMARITGYSRAEILLAPTDAPAHPTRLLMDPVQAQALQDGNFEDAEWEYWTQAKNGAPLCMSVTLSAVRAPDGQLSFFSGLVRDVTALRAAESGLHESRDRLRHLQEELAHIGRVNALGEMAATIAHEINQPLTAITNYMSAGQKLARSTPEDGAAVTQIMQRVAEQALRAGEIIKRIRNFVERRDEHRSAEPVGPLIDSAIDLALLGMDRTGLVLVHEPLAQNIVIHVDPIQIQQVLLILIRNAIEAFGPRAADRQLIISIRPVWDAEAEQVSILVADNGPGLEADIAARLFQPFVTSKPGNMGMGLPIAKRLIEHLDGRLSDVACASGATFRIDLPASPGAPA
ncbi:MAG: CHASE3 domain-containing protein [Chakrabartia sp.]